MARKQSKRALLLSTIRKERMVLTELKDHELCLRNIIKECEKIMESGRIPHHRMKFITVDKNRLKTTIELRKTREKIEKSEARISDLEQQLSVVKAGDAIRKILLEHPTNETTHVKIGPGYASPVTGVLRLEPGWRWIRGFENRYVWSTDGRVGTLKKNLLGDNWTLRLLKPVARGFFKLSIGNRVTIRKSFTMLAAESVDNPLLLKFSDEGLFTAVTLNGQKVIIRLPKGK